MANGKIRFGKQSGGQLALVIPDGVANTEVIVPESGVLVSVGTTVTDNAIVRFDGTTGEVQNSSVTINDKNWINVGGYAEAYIDILAINNNISENIFRAGLAGMSNGLLIRKDSVANMTLIYSNQSGANTFTIDSAGNVLVTGSGGLGYGNGSGGTVTQLTSKSTAVTINKPTGTIYTHNESLAAGASVSIPVSNTLLNGFTSGDALVINGAFTATTINPDGFYGIEPSMVGSGGARIRITNLTGASRAEVIAINFSILKGARV